MLAALAFLISALQIALLFKFNIFSTSSSPCFMSCMLPVGVCDLSFALPLKCRGDGPFLHELFDNFGMYFIGILGTIRSWQNFGSPVPAWLHMFAQITGWPSISCVKEPTDCDLAATSCTLKIVCTPTIDVDNLWLWIEKGIDRWVPFLHLTLWMTFS